MDEDDGQPIPEWLAPFLDPKIFVAPTLGVKFVPPWEINEAAG